MQNRPLCKLCNHRPAAVNYIVKGQRRYRSYCDSCIRKGQHKRPFKPAWLKTGYVKKQICEKCGFKSKFKEQLSVYYVDGNLKNNSLSNLKTICSNCQIEVSKQNLGWVQGDLVPDL